MRTQVKYIVKGYVQGVGFRFFVYRQARALNLNGYVKNIYDGSVEVLAEGESKQLDALFELLKQGPARSIVEKVTKTEADKKGKFDGFNIL
jgi:acylphosphatase